MSQAHERQGGTQHLFPSHFHPYLVLPVVLLRVSQDPVAEPANVSERSVALVPQLLQPQHRAIPAVCEGGLQQLEDLFVKRKGSLPSLCALNSNSLSRKGHTYRSSRIIWKGFLYSNSSKDLKPTSVNHQGWLSIHSAHTPTSHRFSLTRWEHHLADCGKGILR